MPRGKAHYRLTLEDVLAAHDAALQYGGMPGLLDLGIIESAIARPYVTFGGRPRYPRIFLKAPPWYSRLSRIMDSLTGTSEQLNTFLLRSGYVLAASVTDDDVESMILGTAESQIDYSDLVAWFKDRVVPSGE